MSAITSKALHNLETRPIDDFLKVVVDTDDKGRREAWEIDWDKIHHVHLTCSRGREAIKRFAAEARRRNFIAWTKPDNRAPTSPIPHYRFFE